jgi:hypothetical protein
MFGFMNCFLFPSLSFLLSFPFYCSHSLYTFSFFPFISLLQSLYTLRRKSLVLFLFFFFCPISDFKSQCEFGYHLLRMESRIWHTSFALPNLVHYTFTIFYIPITSYQFHWHASSVDLHDWMSSLDVQTWLPCPGICFLPCLCIHHLLLY